MKKRTLTSMLVAGLVCSVVAVSAAASTPRELFRNAFLTPSGHVAKLASGVTYKASDFPLPLRVTAPDGTWGERSGSDPRSNTRRAPLPRSTAG